MRMVPVKAVKFCYCQVIAGFKTLKFLYDQAQSLAGSAAGSSGTDTYGAIEITPNILFISWSMENGEVMSIVANFQNDILHCCNTREGKRHFWKGNIKRFAKASIDRF